MFIESARPDTIAQAIERTEREALDAWAVWGVTPRTQAYAIHRKHGGFGKWVLCTEAANRLRVLHDAHRKAIGRR